MFLIHSWCKNPKNFSIFLFCQCQVNNPKTYFAHIIAYHINFIVINKSLRYTETTAVFPVFPSHLKLFKVRLKLKTMGRLF